MLRRKKNEVMLETAEKIVYAILGFDGIHISEIVAQTGFSVPQTMEVLASLEQKKLVNMVGQHYYAFKNLRDQSYFQSMVRKKGKAGSNMAKNLVIVESPSKATTIKKFLGSTYEVAASNGHVRDLPKSTLGIDIENDFEPKYITIRGKGDLLAKLRKAVKKADKIYLATDPDREGEAISWHLSKALKLDDKNTSRITFNEITKNAVKKSIKEARDIDMNLVDAQQARRVLDRMVGYQISPVLWAKVKRGLSAGRVQSVALRIIADRETEINNFISKEYWTLSGEFRAEKDKKAVCRRFLRNDKRKNADRNRTAA